MASSFLNNLSSTYRQSPSLRNQFATEQDYLDLFDNQKTTPAMAKAFNIDDYEFEDEGIKSITNTAAPIINQGGDNDKGPTGGDYGYKGPGSTGSTTGFNIDDIGEGTIDDEDMPGITGKGLMSLAGFIANPVGFFAKKAFNIAKQKYDNKKRRDKAAQDLAEQAALDAQLAAAQREIAAKGYKDYGQGAADGSGGYNDGDGGSYSGSSTEDYGGGEKDGGYIDGTNRRKDFKNGGFSVLGSSSMTDAVMKRIEALMDEGLDFGSAYTQVKKEAPALAHGGRVKSNNSGSLTEFVKSKLMEDDSQGLPAVQGIAIGMPSDQDGIISISRR
jgi:hypothetical protein